MQPDRRLLFVQNCHQWELTRQRIVDQLIRYGFKRRDRMCISVALDEAMIVALEQTMTANCEATAIAYSISASVFHLRIHLVGGTALSLRAISDRDRWLLAAACMSGLRVDNEAAEIEMWRNNSAIAPVEHDGASPTMKEESK